MKRELTLQGLIMSEQKRTDQHQTRRQQKSTLTITLCKYSYVEAGWRQWSARPRSLSLLISWWIERTRRVATQEEENSRLPPGLTMPRGEKKKDVLPKSEALLTFFPAVNLAAKSWVNAGVSSQGNVQIRPKRIEMLFSHSIGRTKLNTWIYFTCICRQCPVNIAAMRKVY